MLKNLSVGCLFLAFLMLILTANQALAEAKYQGRRNHYWLCQQALAIRSPTLSANELVAELLSKSTSKRETAQAELFLHYIPKAFIRAVNTMGLPPYETDQLSSTVITDSYFSILSLINKNFDREKWKDLFSFYISTAVKNTILDQLRTPEFKLIRKSISGSDFEWLKTKTDFYGKVLMEEILNSSKLSTKEQHILRLRREGLTFEEIAAIVGMQIEATQKSASRAIDKIKD